MKFNTENINRLNSSIIIFELYKFGITHFYISPGMRNAPLIAALIKLKIHHSEVEIVNCIDERSAAYRALGHSKGKDAYACLIATSGTASANYYPAVIEAYKSKHSLIIISADRPFEQAHADDNQTIDQVGLFNKFVRAELALPTANDKGSAKALATSVANLLYKGTYPERGPVHLNCPFREPLENNEIKIADIYLDEAMKLENMPGPITRYYNSNTIISNDDAELFSNIFSHSKSGIIVIGALSINEDIGAIKKLIESFNWPFYLDISSSLKFEFNLSHKIIPTFDHPEVLEYFTNNPPDTIFHIGGRLTSKHYYQFLKQLSGTNLIALNKCADKEDPAHHVSIKINGDIGPSIDIILNHVHELNNGHNLKINFESFASQKINYIDSAPLIFPKISKTIIEQLPNNSILYLGNSTAVRSFDSYISFNLIKNIKMATNRGVSGIEGFIASSSGLIDALNKEVYLVLGDISFLHDLNSLMHLNNIKAPLKIIVINNYCGGIFNLLPIAREKEVLEYIKTPHQLNFNHLAKQFNINYFVASTVEQFKENLNQLIASSKSGILEVVIDDTINQNAYSFLKTIKL